MSSSLDIGQLRSLEDTVENELGIFRRYRYNQPQAFDDWIALATRNRKYLKNKTKKGTTHTAANIVEWNPGDGKARLLSNSSYGTLIDGLRGNPNSQEYVKIARAELARIKR